MPLFLYSPVNLFPYPSAPVIPPPAVTPRNLFPFSPLFVQFVDK